MQDVIPGNLTIQDETNFGSILETFLKNCWPLNVWPTHIWMVHFFCIKLKNNMTLDNSFEPQFPNFLCNSYKQTVSSGLLSAGAVLCFFWSSLRRCCIMQIFFVCEVHCVELFPLLPRKGQTLNLFLISKCLDFVLFCSSFLVSFLVLVTLFIQRKVFSDSYWMLRSVLICCVDFSPVKCWTHLQTVWCKTIFSVKQL